MNKTEIDHISAYLCGHKLSELLLRHYNDKIGRENCKILCFKILCSKVSEKWRLFCFVLTTSLKNVFTVASSSDFRRATFGKRLSSGNLRQQRSLKMTSGAHLVIDEIGRTDERGHTDEIGHKIGG